MVKIKKHGIILKPTSREFEAQSVFNPAVLQQGDQVHIIYRALNKKFVSSLGYARLKGPLKVVERWRQPFLKPKYKYEKKGIEDPRLTKIKDTVYMTFVVHDGKNALTAYAYGPDIFHLRRGGIISPRLSYGRATRLFAYSRLKDAYWTFAAYYKENVAKDVLIWSKDCVLFPEKIKRKYALLHRILPDIQLALFSDFSQLKQNQWWKNYIKNLGQNVVLENHYWFEARHIGSGAPPIKTKKGWLVIYHGAEPKNKGRVYYAAAALLDLNDPRRVIARLPYPLFRPQRDFEKKGFVHNVVFPTGTAVFGDQLYIYYGAADTYVAAASLNLKELLRELSKHKIKK